MEFRGSEHLARPPANPPQMPDGSAWPWCGVQKFKVQKARSSKGSEFKRLGVQRLGVQRLGVQRLGVQRLGVQRLGVQRLGRPKKVLTSSKTEKAPVCVRRMSEATAAPSSFLHRRAEKAGAGAGTGIRGSPRTGRGRKKSPPLRRLMITRRRGGFFFFLISAFYL